MLARAGEHGLEAPAGRLLGVGRRRRRGAHGGQVGAQRVALGLELGEPEHARARPAAARAGRGSAGHDRVGQLMLEAGDLRAQIGAGAPARGPRRGLDEREHRQPPIGARGLAPQKTCVPSIPMRCTSTMFNTIDFAVAVPTPTGPPLAL